MNENGNPDIAKHGEKTQIGKPGALQGGRLGGEKAWSIRSQVKRFAAQEINFDDPKALEKLAGKNPTAAQQIAFRTLQKAHKGSMKAIVFSDERIDGKMPQFVAQTTLEMVQAPEEFTSVEDAAAAYQEFIGR